MKLFLSNEWWHKGKNIIVALCIASGLIILLSLAFYCNDTLSLGVTKPVDKADALVVLAGDSAERVPAAAVLYKEGSAPTIILTNDGVRSGWSKKHQRNLYSIEWNEEALLESGVRPQDIIKLPFYRSGTIYDALTTRTYVEKARLKSIMIVTSDYHTKRSLWTFRHVFQNNPVTLNIYPVKSGTKSAGFLVDNVAMFKRLAVEWGKYIYYRVRFGLKKF